jgi:hypothetical protein
LLFRTQSLQRRQARVLTRLQDEQGLLFWHSKSASPPFYCSDRLDLDSDNEYDDLRGRLDMMYRFAAHPLSASAERRRMDQGKIDLPSKDQPDLPNQTPPEYMFFI